MNQSKWSPKFISFVIPTVNKIGLLEQCIASIHTICMAGKLPDIKYEILVIQDGTSSEITNKLKELCNRYHCHFLQTGRSAGYTFAVNLGLQNAAGDLLVFMNDDICFEQKEWLDWMIKSLQLHPKTGIAGCRLLYPNRRIQHGGMDYSNNFQLLNHRYQGCPENEPAAQRVVRTVAVTGAALAVKREVYCEIGPLNGNFAILCSDTDYCLTAHNQGWIVLYNGKAYAIHHESQTRRQHPKSRQLGKIEYRDQLRFYQKWSSQLKQMHMQRMI